MRHLKTGRKLSRRKSHRTAMLANLAASIITHGRVHTTDAKAKEVRPFLERLVTFARRGDLHARRIVLSRLKDAQAVKKLFDDIGPRYAARCGGYTRIIKLGFRSGDNAPISLIEFVDEGAKDTAKDKKKKAAGKTKARKTTRKKAAGAPKKEETAAAAVTEAKEAEVSPEEKPETEEIQEAAESAETVSEKDSVEAAGDEQEPDVKEADEAVEVKPDEAAEGEGEEESLEPDRKEEPLKTGGEGAQETAAPADEHPGEGSGDIPPVKESEKNDTSEEKPEEDK